MHTGIKWNAGCAGERRQKKKGEGLSAGMARVRVGMTKWDWEGEPGCGGGEESFDVNFQVSGWPAGCDRCVLASLWLRSSIPIARAPISPAL